jgi:hypothetical protein
MKTISSLSGGKTSSYMAKHYLADYNIFSLVRIEAQYCKPKDKSIVKYVSDKIGMDFIATAESDKTLYVMRDLEQLIGENIIWVTGVTFEELIKSKKALPNMMQRFCTTELKMMPIGYWWLNNINEKVLMQIGFRYDEIERHLKFTNDIKLKVGKHENGKNRWKTFDWRVGKFPLIEDKITNYQVNNWAKTININFPPDSNCVGCFWKNVMQLRKNFEDEPQKMRWFLEMEKLINRRWKSKITYEQIGKIFLQQEFNFGTGAGCNAGYCTD